MVRQGLMASLHGHWVTKDKEDGTYFLVLFQEVFVQVCKVLQNECEPILFGQPPVASSLLKVKVKFLEVRF